MSETPMTFRERLEKELRHIETLRTLRGQDLDVDIRREIRAAKTNLQAMAIAKHLEDAVISAVRVTTAEHWREESEKWAVMEAEYQTRLDSRIERINASIAAKLKWLILLVLLILLVIGLGALLLL